MTEHLMACNPTTIALRPHNTFPTPRFWFFGLLRGFAPPGWRGTGHGDFDAAFGSRSGSPPAGTHRSAQSNISASTCRTDSRAR